MAEINTVIAEASQDLQTIEDFVNLPADSEVYPRLLPSVNVGTLAGARQAIFEAGGLPAKPFQTKALMTASDLVDGDFAQVTDDTVNNGLYVKTAGAWVKSNYDPLGQAKSYSDKSALVATQELAGSFLKKSTNLYDKSSVILNKVVNITGDIIDNVGYVISPLIKVTAGGIYTLKAADTIYLVNIAYYRADKSFITRIVAPITAVDTDTQITIPADTYYIRFNININRWLADGNFIFYEGVLSKPYTDYKNPELVKVTAGADLMADINSKVISSDVAANHIVASANLFDSSKTTKGFVVTVTGEVTPNANYWLSDYIAVEPLEQYTTSSAITWNLYPWISIAYYDINKVFINRIDAPVSSKTEPWTMTIPANVRYLRFNINSPDPANGKRMFNKGAAALPYEPSKKVLTNLVLADDVMQQISSDLNIDVVDNVIFDTTTSGTFSTDKVWSYPEFTTIQSASVYAMYEALRLQYPDYITKQALTSDSFGNPISCYKFKPKRPTASVATRFPKIFLTLGTHGGEHVSPLAVYLMLKEMCENWESDELLETLRFNVDILVIPVVNPSGWNAFTRTTGNGVDINRNFPNGWVQGEVGSVTYGGTAPLSEIEAQNVAQVIAENKDIDICYDFHNFHGQDANNGYIWLATKGVYEQHMCQILVNKLTRKWRKNFTWFPASPWFAGHTDATSGAMIQDYARAQGVKFTGTFEVCRTVWAMPSPVIYDSTHCKMHVEAITNWLLINLNEISRV